MCWRKCRHYLAGGSLILVTLVLLEGAAGADLRGDYNRNGLLDAGDLNLQALQMVGDGDPSYDLNGDSVVDYKDRQMWVNELKHTWIGDANLDYEFNSSDMVQVFVRGKYETNEIAGWADGDFNGDMKFNSSDMVATFGGCYEPPCDYYAVAVPEPGVGTLLLLGVALLLTMRRSA